MRRRHFVFRSLPSVLLFSSIFDLRRAEANVVKRVLPFFFVDGGSPFPTYEDFYPGAGNNSNFNLPIILQQFENLKSKMNIVDGINLDPSVRLKGNNHPCSVGKVLTAASPIPTGDNEGLPGGPSIDHVIASTLGLRSTQVLVNNKVRNSIRERPFASARSTFNLPTRSAADSFDMLFKGCQPQVLQTDNAKEERLRRLRADKSVMDDLVDELKRLRAELVGIEKVKLDSHESAIREAERSVARELETVENQSDGGSTVEVDCSKPSGLPGGDIPSQSKAHFDVLYAAIKADRTDVIGMMHGFSSTTWNYGWLGFGQISANSSQNNEHDGIFHRAGTRRDDFVKIAQWKWGELRKFAERLDQEPGGSLLNHVLIYATAHFGLHHSVNRTPVITIGNANGQLQTGRSLKVNSYNDKILTSVAHLCGAKIAGIGNNPKCGRLSEFY